MLTLDATPHVGDTLKRVYWIELTRLLESKQREAASAVETSQASIRAMTTMAPREGTVIYVLNPRNGEKKKVGDSCWKAERVVEIPDLNRMKAEGEVDEVDAGRVAVGQRVTLRLDKR